MITAMSGNKSVGMQGRAMHAGATRTAQGGALAFIAKARVNAADLPPDTLTKGNALLQPLILASRDRGRLGLVESSIAFVIGLDVNGRLVYHFGGECRAGG